MKVNPLADEQDYLRSEFELPEFHGYAEELMDWMVTVEETLVFKRIPLEGCVPLIAMRFRGRAAAWWMQLKTSRERLCKPKISSWDKLKKKMHKTFVIVVVNYDPVMLQRLKKLRQGDDSVEIYYTKIFSLLTNVDLQGSDQKIVAHYVGGLRKKIRDHFKLSNPITLAEAHQQALTMEAQTKNDLDKDIWDVLLLCSSTICFVTSLLSYFRH